MKAVSVEQAVAMIPDGASVMIGGFMAIGTPERLIDELVRQISRDLTIIANDAASRVWDRQAVRHKLVGASLRATSAEPQGSGQMMDGSSASTWCPKVRLTNGSAPEATGWVVS